MPAMIQNEAAYEAARNRKIRANANKTFMKRDRAADVVNWVYSARGDFAASLANSLETYGKLTDKQFDAVLRCIERDAARKVEWEAKRLEIAALGGFVGSEGEKISLDNVKVEAVITINATRFSYYDRGSQEMYLLRDAAGNRIVFKTKNYIDVQKGDVVSVAGRIKAHQEFRGEKQTLINRAKFVVTQSAV